MRQWLFTPLANPQTAQELRYTNMHTRTRVVVERTIGHLKGRWRCLDKSGGVLLYRPEKVCRVVLACGVLHNIAQRHGVPLGDIDLDEDPDPGPPPNEQPDRNAIRLRQQFIATL